MSENQTEYRKNLKHPPAVRSSTTVIQRTPAGSQMIGPSIRSQRTSMRMSTGPSFAAGTLSGMSHKGVNEVISERKKERQTMQGLNERFAGYIEKVRFLEAQNKALSHELEKLKNLKTFDFKEIKDYYEQEIQECRKIIDELNKEKSTYDTTVCGLQDALDDEKREHDETKKTADELREKLNRTCDQIGEYEGEIAALRCRVNNLEDENKKLKEANKRHQDDIARIRQDLDVETKKRLDGDAQIMMLEDRLQFERNVADMQEKEFDEYMKRDRGMEDVQQIWKGQLAAVVKDLQAEYENQVEVIKCDCENRLEAQCRQLTSGIQRDNMESEQLKEEIKRLKSKIGDVNPRLSELESENARLKSRLQLSEEELHDLRSEFDTEMAKKQMRIDELEAELNSVLEELQCLQDAKMSLELEISCYKKLLDGEESIIQASVEKATNARSASADKLAGIIQQSSMQESGDLQENVGRATVTKSHRGCIAFVQVHNKGLFVEIENNGGGSGQQKTVNLQNWKVTKTVKNDVRCRFEFDGAFMLKPGESVILHGNRVKENELPPGKKTLKCNFSTWFQGGGCFHLIDTENSEKASMEVKVM